MKVQVARNGADAGGKQPRRGVPILIAMIVLALLGFPALDALMYPWAVSLTGRPTLGGDWYGELITPAGRKHWVTLDLGAQGGGTRGDLKGAQRIRSGVWGKPQNWHGRPFHIALFARDERSEGLRLIKLEGEWDRQDVIRATAAFESGGPATMAVDCSGAVTRPGADPDTLFPVTSILRRGSEREFQIGCKRLVSHAEPASHRSWS